MIIALSLSLLSLGLIALEIKGVNLLLRHKLQHNFVSIQQALELFVQSSKDNIELLTSIKNTKKQLISCQTEVIELKGKVAECGATPGKTSSPSINTQQYEVLGPFKVLAYNYPQQGYILAIVGNTHIDPQKKYYAISSQKFFVGNLHQRLGDWAIIKTIYSADFSISALITQARAIGVLKHNKNQIILEEVPATAKIKEEMIVWALDPINLPSGIVLGKAKQVIPIHASSTLNISVQPAIEYNSLDSIYLISRRSK